MNKKFYEKGLHFECQGSGKCCVSRGSYGFVYLTKDDKKKMARLLKMKLADFERDFCQETDGVSHLIQPAETDDCLFLKDKRCEVYHARPVQCRTWPFWPENMNSKAWKRDVVAFCPGARVKTKTSLRTAKVIEPQLVEQAESEVELFGY